MNCKVCMNPIEIDRGFYKVGDDCYCIDCYNRPTSYFPNAQRLTHNTTVNYPLFKEVKPEFSVNNLFKV